MRKLFKAAFPNNYRNIRTRFVTLFIIYEAFLSFRAMSYYYIQFSFKKADIQRVEESVFYTTEILLIGFLSFISLKSTQDDESKDYDDN